MPRDDDVDGIGRQRLSRWQSWKRKKPSLESPKSGAVEPWSWSLKVSDWPIGKTSYDLTADQAVRAVLGLGKYYEPAMTGLAKAEEHDDVGGTLEGQGQDQ
jgi:hypothetical protein